MRKFSGVPLAALLDRLGVEAGAGTIELVAPNNHRVEIPIEEIDDSAPIVATRIDGETFPVREMGPYWMVYPTISIPATGPRRPSRAASGSWRR